MPLPSGFRAGVPGKGPFQGLLYRVQQGIEVRGLRVLVPEIDNKAGTNKSCLFERNLRGYSLGFRV